MQNSTSFLMLLLIAAVTAPSCGGIAVSDRPTGESTEGQFPFLNQGDPPADEDDTATSPWCDGCKRTIELISVSSQGEQGNDITERADMTDDGKTVVFFSYASNLVADDHNGILDVFLRDVEARTTVRLSVGVDGQDSDGESHEPVIAGGGRYVAYSSQATNLVRDDNNELEDIFVHDYTGGTTVRVSVGWDGGEANGASTWPRISDDGRYVVFTSEASNLVPDDTNGVSDVFLRDMTSGQTKRVSVGPGNLELDRESTRGEISDDGRFVGFTSFATNLIDGYDGAHAQIYLYDLSAGNVTLISKGLSGSPGNGDSVVPDLGTAAAWVLFTSLASDLVENDKNDDDDAFLWERATGKIRRLSVGPGGKESTLPSAGSAISGDGKYAAFSSFSQSIAPDTQPANGVGNRMVFVSPLPSGLIEHASYPTGPGPENNNSSNARFSYDASSLIFRSWASDLIEGDNNGHPDIFLVRVERD